MLKWLPILVWGLNFHMICPSVCRQSDKLLMTWIGSLLILWKLELCLYILCTLNSTIFDLQMTYICCPLALWPIYFKTKEFVSNRRICPFSMECFFFFTIDLFIKSDIRWYQLIPKKHDSDVTSRNGSKVISLTPPRWYLNSKVISYHLDFEGHHLIQKYYHLDIIYY